MNATPRPTTSWMDDEDAIESIAASTFKRTEGTAMDYAVQSGAARPGVLIRKVSRAAGGRNVLVWMPDTLIERLREQTNGPWSVAAVALADHALDGLMERGERLVCKDRQKPPALGAVRLPISSATC